MNNKQNELFEIKDREVIEKIVHELAVNEMYADQSLLVNNLLRTKDTNLHISPIYNNVGEMPHQDDEEQIEWWLISDLLAQQIENISGLIIRSNFGIFWGTEDPKYDIPFILIAIATSLYEEGY